MSKNITSPTSAITSYITSDNAYLTDDGSDYLITHAEHDGAGTYTITGTTSTRSTVITDTDVIFADGTTLMGSIKKINERLNILTPDPELLAKYKALQDAYEQYKVLEALLNKNV